MKLIFTKLNKMFETRSFFVSRIEYKKPFLKRGFHHFTYGDENQKYTFEKQEFNDCYEAWQFFYTIKEDNRYNRENVVIDYAPIDLNIVVKRETNLMCKITSLVCLLDIREVQTFFYANGFSVMFLFNTKEEILREVSRVSEEYKLELYNKLKNL
jgi:hypothetical protein